MSRRFGLTIRRIRESATVESARRRHPVAKPTLHLARDIGPAHVHVSAYMGIAPNATGTRRAPNFSPHLQPTVESMGPIYGDHKQGRSGDVSIALRLEIIRANALTCARNFIGSTERHLELRNAMARILSQ